MTSIFKTENNQMVFTICTKCKWYKAHWSKSTDPKKYPFEYDWCTCEECGHEWVDEDGFPFHRTDGYPCPNTTDVCHRPA